MNGLPPAAPAVEGAQALFTAGHGERWPTPRGAAEHVQQYLDENNPFDAFLRARFVEAADGFVATEVLWKQLGSDNERLAAGSARALAVFRGTQAGFAAGEGFHILRMTAPPEALAAGLG